VVNSKLPRRRVRKTGAMTGNDLEAIAVLCTSRL